MQLFLTGATGFLGSHVAAAAVEAGHSVRALARPSSDLRHLRSLGAEIVLGDLGDMRSLLVAAEGCDVVIHVAAKVGDSGGWQEHFAATVQSTRRVYDAAAAVGVRRAVHVSSVAVYGHKRLKQVAIDESRGPLAEGRLPRWYFYGRAKALAEGIAMQFQTDGILSMSVVRPGWIYGPRDRAGLPRLLRMLAAGTARVIGSGENALSLTYVTNVADAILLAAEDPRAVGQVFNVANDQDLTQRRLLDALADMLAVPRPSEVSLGAATAAAWAIEKSHRWFKLPGKPLLTRQAVRLLSLDSRFSTEKIRSTLGWRPRIDFGTALANIAAWWSGEMNPAIATSLPS